MEELPEDAWNHIFPRNSERKGIWCDMACLRIYRVRNELSGCFTPEMSCSRYWIGRALEDAKGEVSMAEYEVRAGSAGIIT